MRRSLILLLLIAFVFLHLPIAASADMSHRIHSPRGDVITLVIASDALKEIRIYNLEFSDDGGLFIITAAPLQSTETVQTIRIIFYDGPMVVQSEYVDIGPGKTAQELYCTETFDRIVVGFSG